MFVRFPLSHTHKNDRPYDLDPISLLHKYEGLIGPNRNVGKVCWVGLGGSKASGLGGSTASGLKSYV